MDDKLNEEPEIHETERRCEDCGGWMTWCESCEMWSRSCCQEYGTCMCS
jgi:hypothetical protein